MSYFSMADYKFIKFEKANAKDKKYSAIIKNTNTGTTKRINFGDKRYQHYFDDTGLKIYTHLNHNDQKRRKNYISRHSVFIKKGFYSPGYFSMKYLW
jgi:hypothetical protein